MRLIFFAGAFFAVVSIGVGLLSKQDVTTAWVQFFGWLILDKIHSLRDTL